MKTDVKSDPNVHGQLVVTMTCSSKELLAIGEGLQMALDERIQHFGTYLIKAAKKNEE